MQEKIQASEMLFRYVFLRHHTEQYLVEIECHENSDIRVDMCFYNHRSRIYSKYSLARKLQSHSSYIRIQSLWRLFLEVEYSYLKTFDGKLIYIGHLQNREVEEESYFLTTH
jgi:hypothetical protein